MTDSHGADSHGADAWEPATPSSASGQEVDWPLRPLLLGAIGLATGLAVHWLVEGQPDLARDFSALRLAELVALLVGAGMFGFTVEQRSWIASLVFALAAGAVAAGIIYWNGEPKAWGGGDGWRMMCLFLALAIAAPLFQAGRDARGGDGESRLPYAAVHDHAWTNIVLWGACWAFVGIVFALMWLLASLFGLIRIEFLRELLMKQWFIFALAGLAFGAALGLFREHDMVVRLLHRVVASVLAVLAPVLALGLAVFLLALPFTGLGTLWDSWVSATALLLACMVGALVLANAVIGNSPGQESRIGVLRIGAMVLGVVMLPLAVLASIAIGMRIGQYGYTPERLWALTFIVFATAFGLAYLVSLIRGRMGWAAHVRPANLNLAVAVCLVTLLLATPLVSFNAISASDQVARLEAGRISPEKFDWRALAFDFGKPGRDALAKLKTSKNAAIARRATEIAAFDDRWQVGDQDREAENREQLAKSLRILPADTTPPDALRDAIGSGYECRGGTGCTLVMLAGGKEALLFRDSCYSSGARNAGACYDRYVLVEGKWLNGGAVTLDEDATKARRDAGYKAGQIEVRPVQSRQVFVGGVPVGEPFE